MPSMRDISFGDSMQLSGRRWPLHGGSTKYEWTSPLGDVRGSNIMQSLTDTMCGSTHSLKSTISVHSR
jgi:hypothetical protein